MPAGPAAGHTPYATSWTAQLTRSAMLHQEELPTCGAPECGEPCRINTGVLAVPASYLISSVFSPYVRWSTYGAPTDIKVLSDATQGGE